MANGLLPLISPNRAENNVEKSRDCEAHLLCKPFQQKSWFKLNTTYQLCFLDCQVLDSFFVFVGIRRRRLNESSESSPYMVGGLNSVQSQITTDVSNIYCISRLLSYADYFTQQNILGVLTGRAKIVHKFCVQL